ncbi:glycosyltransferase family 4 protein [Caldifermentibacillus hisashii]|uniref:glycosyltransferase family 4 protein n=1 Tax=Caldifermentibacillus hisashii TaxID=996558 RepID=UPI002E0B6BEB|nr:glycosyltransferase family 4 protein [Caldifermentibacillus hisashii]
MKILNINSYYYSSSVHRQLQIALQKQGIDTSNYVPLSKEYTLRYIFNDSKSDFNENIDVIRCYSSIQRFFYHLKQRKILNDIVNRYDFNDYKYLHAHSLFSNGYIAMRIKQIYGVPYIVAVRDTDINTFFKYMYHLRKVGIDILKNADHIVFLSKPYRSFLINKYIPRKYRDEILDKSIIIPNGIDEFWFINQGNPKSLSKQNYMKLLYVGAINKRKNITSTLGAIRILQNKGFTVQLTVVGKIEDNLIYNQFKDLPYVKYISPVENEKLLSIYRENDVFIMPSITETFGLVYAEAMSQGLPVIYTKGQGFDGHFEEGEVGYSVDCFDVEDIANSIIKIKNNYEVLSKNSICFFKRFNWDRISNDYLKLYTSIV